MASLNSKVKGRKKTVNGYDLGTCDDDENMNICRFNRDPYSNIYTLDIQPGISVDGTARYNVLSKKWLYISLGQDPDILQLSSEKRLDNIVISINMSSYHGRNPMELTGKDGEKFKLTPFQGSALIRMMIVQVCNKDKACRPVLMPDDVFINPNDFSSELFPEFTILRNQDRFIDCSGCNFEDHVFQLCYQFKDNKTCILSSNKDENIVFNSGTFALIFYIDYMSSASAFKRLRYEVNDERRYEFGETFDLSDGSVGRSFIINRFFIEFTYKNIMNNGGGGMFLKNIETVIKKVMKGDDEKDPEYSIVQQNIIF
ncbi:MAG TPA: hypothetical protein VIY08_00655 [Candidatus Nitrosocosmicus sp.]